jgi:hypothetical protein
VSPDGLRRQPNPSGDFEKEVVIRSSRGSGTQRFFAVENFPPPSRRREDRRMPRIALASGRARPGARSGALARRRHERGVSRAAPSNPVSATDGTTRAVQTSQRDCGRLERLLELPSKLEGGSGGRFAGTKAWTFLPP